MVKIMSDDLILSCDWLTAALQLKLSLTNGLCYEQYSAAVAQFWSKEWHNIGIAVLLSKQQNNVLNAKQSLTLRMICICVHLCCVNLCVLDVNISMMLCYINIPLWYGRFEYRTWVNFQTRKLTTELSIFSNKGDVSDVSLE